LKRREAKVSLFLFLCIMNLNETKAIIFDLGGVILNLDYSLTIDKFKKLGITDFETLYSQASQQSLFDDLETGKISTQTFVNSLLPFLPRGVTANEVVHAWNAMILDFPTERLTLLEKLRTKYKIYLLSNTNEIHEQVVRRVLSKVSDKGLEDYFDQTFLSHQVGLRKPNADIFKYVCDKADLIPSQTLFIDDTLQHIEGARLVGLRVHHLTPGTTIQALFS
jgi:HAD superfamily hydrolase (TIGR01509 family)